MTVNRIIDVHSHMFNGFSVPMEEIFIHHDVPMPVAIALAGLLKLLMGKPPKPLFDDTKGWLKLADEIKDIDGYAKTIARIVKTKLRIDLEGDEVEKKLDQKNGSDVALLVKRVTELFEQDRLQRGEPFDAGEFMSGVIRGLTFVPNDTLSDELRKKLFDHTFDEALYNTLRKYLGFLKDFSNFLLNMMVDDRTLFDTLLNDTYRQTNRPALAIHLTMDIEPAYWSINKNRKTIGCKYDFVERQIPTSVDFIKEANGHLLGFVAFHPARGEKGIKGCFQALHNGHVGIKIYPPMNYRPDGVGMKNEGKFTEVPDYSGVLTELYNRCASEDIPIIAHCTSQGFEPWKGTGPLSNPVYWRNFLENPAHGDLRRLRLCLAHCGGGSSKAYDDIYQDKYGLINMGWYSKPDEWLEKKGYAGEIVALCRDFDNVYADFSYLTEIIDDTDCRQNLMSNLKREILASGKLADRIMYGSDWPMQDMASKTNKFLDTLRAIFNGSDFDPLFADKFFFTNAVRFLNLEGFIERHEHNSFFSKEGLDYLKNVCAMAQE